MFKFIKKMDAGSQAGLGWLLLIILLLVGIGWAAHKREAQSKREKIKRCTIACVDAGGKGPSCKSKCKLDRIGVNNKSCQQECKAAYIDRKDADTICEVICNL